MEEDVPGPVLAVVRGPPAPARLHRRLRPVRDAPRQVHRADLREVQGDGAAAQRLPRQVCVCVCVYARCIQYRQPPFLPGIVLVVVPAITSVTAAVGRLVLFTAFVVCDWTLGAATGLSWKSAMSVRRHTKALADGERSPGEPRLQLALSTSHCLFVSVCHA